MNKYVLTFVSIALILSFGACSNEDLTEIEKENDYTLSFTASMPDDHTPTTRLSLTDDAVNKLINVEWKNGDQIRVVIVQNGNVFKVNNGNPIAITPDPSNKKKGNFSIQFLTWWTLKKSAPFKVYGVYGASGIGDTKVKLPIYHQESLSTLEGLGNTHQVMLYFSYDHLGVPTNKAPDSDDAGDISVKFEHIGSLFRINLKNTGNDTRSFGEVRLTGVGTNNKWAYNTQFKEFDLVTKKFVNTEAENYMNIFFDEGWNNLTAGNTLTAWRWHAIDGSQWPELKLELTNGETILYTSGTAHKRARTLLPGQLYEINANINGSVITFP